MNLFANLSLTHVVSKKAFVSKYKWSSLLDNGPLPQHRVPSLCQRCAREYKQLLPLLFYNVIREINSRPSQGCSPREERANQRPTSTSGIQCRKGTGSDITLTWNAVIFANSEFTLNLCTESVKLNRKTSTLFLIPETFPPRSIDSS